MPGFTKLFSDIVTSSIWTEDNTTRIVWITMLAIADQKGRVFASLPGLAQVAHVDREDCRKAISILESPDVDSRTKEYEGRRIEPIADGWVILNYAKHRARGQNEERRDYKTQWQRDSRNLQHLSSECPQVSTQSPLSASASASVLPESIRTDAMAEAWQLWLCHRAEIKKPITPRSAAMSLKTLAVMGEKRAIAAIQHSIVQGYQGIFEPKKGLRNSNAEDKPLTFCP